MTTQVALQENKTVVPDGFTPVSEKWPKYAERVLFVRKDGTMAPGCPGDNGVYFKMWGHYPEPHQNMLGWKPLDKKELL